MGKLAHKSSSEDHFVHDFDAGFTGAPAGSPAAELQNLIYQRFVEGDGAVAYAADWAQESRGELAIQFISRWGGVGLFVAALAAIILAVL